MIRFYDPSGNPISLEESNRLMTEANADPDQHLKRVARDVLPDGRLVSTVWLGFDHAFGEGPPMIFETMVFSADSLLQSIYCKRYSTRDEALAGHRWVVTHLLAGDSIWGPP